MSITRLIVGEIRGQTRQKGGLIGSTGRRRRSESMGCGEGKLVPENGRGVRGLKRFRLPYQLRKALHQAQAAVPAQQRVIVALGTDFLRLFKAAHGILKTG